MPLLKQFGLDEGHSVPLPEPWWRRSVAPVLFLGGQLALAAAWWRFEPELRSLLMVEVLLLAATSGLAGRLELRIEKAGRRAALGRALMGRIARPGKTLIGVDRVIVEADVSRPGRDAALRLYAIRLESGSSDMKVIERLRYTEARRIADEIAGHLQLEVIEGSSPAPARPEPWIRREAPETPASTPAAGIDGNVDLIEEEARELGFSWKEGRPDEPPPFPKQPNESRISLHGSRYKAVFEAPSMNPGGAGAILWIFTLFPVVLLGLVVIAVWENDYGPAWFADFPRLLLLCLSSLLIFPFGLHYATRVDRISVIRGKVNVRRVSSIISLPESVIGIEEITGLGIERIQRGSQSVDAVRMRAGSREFTLALDLDRPDLAWFHEALGWTFRHFSTAPSQRSPEIPWTTGAMRRQAPVPGGMTMRGWAALVGSILIGYGLAAVWGFGQMEGTGPLAGSAGEPAARSEPREERPLLRERPPGPAVSPESEACVNSGAKLVDRNDLAAAAEKLEQCIALDPDNRDAYYHLDRALFPGRELQRIIDYWDRYLARHPDDPVALIEVAGTYMHQGDRKKAFERASRACDLGLAEACARIGR